MNKSKIICFHNYKLENDENQSRTGIEVGVPVDRGLDFIYELDVEVDYDWLKRNIQQVIPGFDYERVKGPRGASVRSYNMPCSEMKAAIEQMNKENSFDGRIHDWMPFFNLLLFRAKSWYSRFLERRRRKGSEVYDFITQFLSFVLSGLMVLAPFFFSRAWVRVLVEVVFLSLYVLAREAKKVKEITAIENHHKEDIKHIESQNADKLKKQQETNDRLIKEHQAKEKGLEEKMNRVVAFAHRVADKAKKHEAQPLNSNEDFFCECADDVEKILSEEYNKDISVSIKVIGQDPGSDKMYVSTLGAGENNIGAGRFCATKKVNIADNYIYTSLINSGNKYYSNPDLTKFTPTREGKTIPLCEYGNRWRDYFVSTIVIPIRYVSEEGNTLLHNIVGFVCVDCKDVITDWGQPKLIRTNPYHIIAIVADSLAQVLKQGVA